MIRSATALLLTAFLFIGCGSSTANAEEEVTKVGGAAIAARLPAKIQQIQKELPPYLKKTGNKEALALMQQLEKQIEAKQYEAAEKTADTLLNMMGLEVPSPGPNGKPGKQQSESPEELTKRLTAKVARVQEGAQKWAASGRDPSEVLKTMQEKFQPLMQAGKIVEAEALVDSVLKQFGMDVNVPTTTTAEPPSEERVLKRIHLIQKERADWIKKSGKQTEFDAMIQTLKEQLAEMNFVEAEKTADAILKMMGVSIPNSAPAQPQAQTHNAKSAKNPSPTFIPQKLLFLASERIGLSSAQKTTLLEDVNKTQPRLQELKNDLERESSALKELTSQDRLDEKEVLVQFNKILDLEREAKQLEARQGIAIHNLLSVEQRTTLHELIGNPDALASLEEEFKNRISGKVEQITAKAEALGQSGRDPSFIAKAMEENVRPLMDSGRVFEAEVELDRLLAQLNKDSE